jgi:prolyl-tRNA synthetase
MARFRDRHGKQMVIAPSHEEAFVELVKNGIRSYRDLPLFLYQFQHKYRDEERTRSGLLRAREFTMKDAYSFHRSASDLNNFFPRVFAAYERIFRRCGLEIEAAESGVGYMGGVKAYEFVIPCEHGDDIMMRCPGCGYRANRDVAMGHKEFTSGTPKPLSKVATPGCDTMDKLSARLSLPKQQLAKAMLLTTLDGVVMAVVRGDNEVSLEKLSRYLNEPVLDIAEKEEVERHGFVPGFLSPIGRHDEVPVIVDGAVAKSTNLVLGANEQGYHYLNSNFGRDYESANVADISMITAENRCLQCGEPLEAVRCLELGNIFKLGDFYSRSMNLSFREESGRQVYPHMGSYGIGIGRLIGAIAEQLHDERGLHWPDDLAPFSFFLMGIGKSHSVKQRVEWLYTRFREETLLDDRKESPGKKFQDAELLGIPYRVVISPKRLEEDLVELYDRRNDRSWLVSTSRILEEMEKLRASLRNE